MPDKPDTPGRGRVYWTPDHGKVTSEQHPYQPGKHQGPHFHWQEPGTGKRHDFFPGDPFPWL